jgi:cytochrome c oxidase subunit IV
MADHSHSHDPHASHDAHAEHGHGGVGKYVIVFLVLLALTAISFAVGNSQTLRENSPGTMWAMMMAVSCAKAMLVILFFMHILWEANWKYVLTIPASMMSIFLLLMLVPDIGRRTERYSEERWLYAAEPEPPPEPAPAGETGAHGGTGAHAQDHDHAHDGGKSDAKH